MERRWTRWLAPVASWLPLGCLAVLFLCLPPAAAKAGAAASGLPAQWSPAHLGTPDADSSCDTDDDTDLSSSRHLAAVPHQPQVTAAVSRPRPHAALDFTRPSLWHETTAIERGPPSLSASR
jgi:hypothetical protein